MKKIYYKRGTNGIAPRFLKLVYVNAPFHETDIIWENDCKEIGFIRMNSIRVGGDFFKSTIVKGVKIKTDHKSFFRYVCRILKK